LSEDSQQFSVIPDGYAAQDIVYQLKKQLHVPLLYGGLDVIRSMQPQDFILQDDQAFEDFGFHVVGRRFTLVYMLSVGHTATTLSRTAPQLQPS
jgi:hypothetical protein